MEPGFKLIAALCDHTDAETAEIVSKCIYCLFDFQDRNEDLLKFVVSREIRTTSKLTEESNSFIIGDSKHLFREDKMTFRVISAFMNQKARDWLKSVFGPLVKEMSNSNGSYEVNPDRLEKPKMRKDNLKR